MTLPASVRAGCRRMRIECALPSAPPVKSISTLDCGGISSTLHSDCVPSAEVTRPPLMTSVSKLSQKRTLHGTGVRSAPARSTGRSRPPRSRPAQRSRARTLPEEGARLIVSAVEEVHVIQGPVVVDIFDLGVGGELGVGGAMVVDPADDLVVGLAKIVLVPVEDVAELELLG